MTETSAAGAGAAQPSFAALRHRGFRVYFVTTALAMMADNIEHVISYWVMFEKFHSPALAGFAVLSHWLPFLFFSVYFGAMADRFDSRRIIQIAMLLFMAVSLAWARAVLHRHHRDVARGACCSSCTAWRASLWGPASQVLIHDIVGRGEPA